MAYAERTDVPVEKTKAEMEKTVMRAGATAYVCGQDGDKATVMFRMKDRLIKFTIRVPDLAQQQRTKWRALLLVVKAKLEAIASGIVTFEDEFLAQTVMSDGKTVAEHVQPAIAENYRVGGPPRLLIGAPSRGGADA